MYQRTRRLFILTVVALMLTTFRVGGAAERLTDDQMDRITGAITETASDMNDALQASARAEGTTGEAFAQVDDFAQARASSKTIGMGSASASSSTETLRVPQQDSPIARLIPPLFRDFILSTRLPN